MDGSDASGGPEAASESRFHGSSRHTDVPEKPCQVSKRRFEICCGVVLHVLEGTGSGRDRLPGGTHEIGGDAEVLNEFVSHASPFLPPMRLLGVEIPAMTRVRIEWQGPGSNQLVASQSFSGLNLGLLVAS